MRTDTLIASVWNLIGKIEKGIFEQADIMFHVLTQLEVANLELVGSSKGAATYKQVINAAASTGTIADNQFGGEYEAAYFAPAPSFAGGTPELRDYLGTDREIKIVRDYEDILEARRYGKNAILFSGARSENYELSFDVAAGKSYDIWLFGKKILLDTDYITDEIDLPELFANVIAYRAADIALDELLLPSVVRKFGDYSSFVVARKQSISKQQQSLEHRWLTWRAGGQTGSGGGLIRTEFYDPMRDLFSD